MVGDETVIRRLCLSYDGIGDIDGDMLVDGGVMFVLIGDGR